ncbi:MAG: YjbQ family protein [Deltaproteobacteria bacterium]|nr:YjbQ family protein [Deltaproteobacteria bacterium]
MIATIEEFHLETRGHSDVHDITARLERAVQASGIAEGLLTVFVPGSTASVTSIEFEPGAVSDLQEAVRKLAPEGPSYRHDSRWGDGNGFSHVRAALLGPSLAIPVHGGQLLLGTWQQVVVIDHDNRPRTRQVLVQLLGTP